MPHTAYIDSIMVTYADAPAATSYDAPTGFVAPGGISTVIVDSIAADTVPGRMPHFITAAEADSLQAQTEAIIEEQPVPSGLREGLEPMPLPPDAAGTVLSALMAGALILAAFNAQSVARALKSYRAELWSVRHRPNVFDDETSVRAPIAILLGFIFIIFGGITLYYIPERPAEPSLAGILASMGLVGAYYLFQICAYSTVGYAFADGEQDKRWMGGFFATQAYAGLAMALPALLMTTMPELAHPLAVTSVAAYAIAHTIFIIKGFRIFYHKISSLLYFILYLCTLEIIPVMALYAISLLLTGAIR